MRLSLESKSNLMKVQTSLVGTDLVGWYRPRWLVQTSLVGTE